MLQGHAPFALSKTKVSSTMRRRRRGSIIHAGIGMKLLGAKLSASHTASAHLEAAPVADPANHPHVHAPVIHDKFYPAAPARVARARGWAHVP